MIDTLQNFYFLQFCYNKSLHKKLPLATLAFLTGETPLLVSDVMFDGSGTGGVSVSDVCRLDLGLLDSAEVHKVM